MSNQSGSAIFYILIAIILFAALGFAFSQTMNSSASNLTKEEARVYAQDVISYANRLSRGVQRVMAVGGCSENDISFFLTTNTLLAAYEHTPEVDDKCKVFHESGGSITWLTAPEGVNDGSDWIFTGNNRIRDIGSYLDGTGNELLAFLPAVDSRVCEQINQILNITKSGDPIPLDDADLSTDLFTGEYSTSISRAIYKPSAAYVGKSSACFKTDTIDGATPSGDVYYFYHVLVAR